MMCCVSNSNGKVELKNNIILTSGAAAYCHYLPSRLFKNQLVDKSSYLYEYFGLFIVVEYPAVLVLYKLH